MYELLSSVDESCGTGYHFVVLHCARALWEQIQMLLAHHYLHGRPIPHGKVCKYIPHLVHVALIQQVYLFLQSMGMGRYRHNIVVEFLRLYHHHKLVHLMEKCI